MSDENVYMIFVFCKILYMIFVYNDDINDVSDENIYIQISCMIFVFCESDERVVYEHRLIFQKARVYMQRTLRKMLIDTK